MDGLQDAYDYHDHWQLDYLYDVLLTCFNPNRRGLGEQTCLYGGFRCVECNFTHEEKN